MFNKWRKRSRNNLLEKGPEHGDSNLNGGVVEDAEREIEMSKSAQNQRRARFTSPTQQQQQQQQQLLQKDRQVSPSTGSPSTISPGTKRRISASAVGSASKVLQLMTERHGEMQNRTQEIRNTVAVAHNTMLDKVESLSKEFMEKHGELKRLAIGMAVGFAILFGMCLAVLVQLFRTTATSA